jgi:hypothetical protein
MKELEIRSNYHARPLIYGHDLTEKERKDFDYIIDDSAEADDGIFFRYKGNVYDIGEFMRLDRDSLFPKFWHAYTSDTFFSGVLIRLCDETDADRLSLPFPEDYVIVGQYFS